MRRLTLPILCTVQILVLAVAALAAAAEEPPQRVLTIGGSLTEIVFALGQGDRLVARDSTSTFPAEAGDLPDVGYVRALSPEGVLSVAPDLILSEEGAGPPEALALLRSARIPFVTVPETHSAEGIAGKIRAVGKALGVSERAERLAAEVERGLAEVQADAPSDAPRRVLFILSTQGGRILASGTGTAADAMIRMSGAVNALDAFQGYKPLTEEAVSAAAPDAILMMDRDGAPNDADLLAMPALRATPAARDGAVIRMDGLYLLGFGPRTAQAVRDLSASLHPDRADGGN